MKINLDNLRTEGWQKILKGKPLPPKDKILEGYCVLIKGLPGTGKTSLGLSILYELCKKGEKAVVYTLIEPGEQILKLIDSFNWQFQNRLKIVGIDADEIYKLSFLDIDNIRNENIKYIMIDGISILKYKHNYPELKDKMLEIVKKLKKENFHTFLVSEESVSEEDRFFEYIVDGVINLNTEGPDKQRFMEISKMRFADYYPGKHGFKIKIDSSGDSGIVIFPSIRCYVNEKINKRENCQSIKSGIPGFDRLIKREDKLAFDPGDMVLVMGEPGTGKSLFSLEFMREILCSNNGEEGIWVSLESNYGELESYSTGFADKTGKAHFAGLLNSKQFKFIHFNTADLLLDEFTNVIVNLLKNNRITRVVIDPISILARKFTSENDYVEYVASLIRILKSAGVVAMLTYGIPKHFQRLGNLEILNNADVDMTVHLRNYDINNTLSRACVVTKSRKSNYDSLLQNVGVTIEGGLYIVQKGWENVGLLGGDPENISESRPFFKFFYQNYSARAAYEEVFNDFKDRYPEDQVFRMVNKSYPSPEHWSFRGYFGPGHSNTKVVALKKYFMDKLREKGVLMDVPKDVIETNLRRFDRSFIWKDNAGENGNSRMFPLYADIGVMCYRKEYAKKIFKDEVWKEGCLEITWDDLKSEVTSWKDKTRDIRDTEKKEKKPGPGVEYLFLLPGVATDTSNFMGFFLEMLWGHGGNLFPDEESWSYANGKLKDIGYVKECFRKGIMSKEFLETLKFIKGLVDDKVCPNPHLGGHYHKAIFSRRWYSKVDQYPEKKDKKRPEYENPLKFSIAPLPRIGETKPSISALEIYCVGIIKGALAPETGWMFVNEMVAPTAEKKRIALRRGLPVDKNLCDSVEEFEEGRKGDFKIIRPFLNIKDEKGNVLIKRNTDIPFYYDIERAIAPVIEGVFSDKDSKEIEKRQERIFGSVEDCLDKIFKKGEGETIAYT